MTTDPDSPPTAVHDAFHEAFVATAEARARLRPDELVPINLDVHATLTKVLGALPYLVTLREDIAVHLPHFDLVQFDSIRSYAEALSFAQTTYLTALRPSDTLAEQVSRAIEIREQLILDTSALVRRNVIHRKVLAKLKGGTGALQVSSDLGLLVHVLRARWHDIHAKTAIHPSELDEAERLSENIVLLHAARMQPSHAALAAAADRQRTYTLLINAYNQARRAAAYLRWSHHDTDHLVPSLWAGRGGRGTRKTRSSEPPIVPAPHVVEPSDTPPNVPESTPRAG